MSIVLVTANQYIIASRIYHITMDEQITYNDIYLKNGKRKTDKDRFHQITIIYAPDDNSTTSSNSMNKLGSTGDSRECTVIIRGIVNAHKCFRELVEQIREQIPDQMYLNKALERMLGATDLTVLEEQDNKNRKDDFDMEDKHDTRPKKVRSTRKAKRDDKKVLRKSKLRR